MPELLTDAEIIDNGIHVDEIQGNVLAGFNKDHEALLFVRFGNPAGAKDWLRHLAKRVATTAEVVAFNRLFKTINERRQDPDDTDTVQATWLNLALTHAGFAELGADTAGMDEAFAAGMSTRASILGDTGEADPTTWEIGGTADEVHAVLIIASDRHDDLHRAIAHELRHIAGHGIHVVFVQEGHTRADDPGHEHFGYKDGISQPGLKGFHKPNPADEEQGDLGSDLLEIGEFVLGYPTQPGPPQPPPADPNYSGPTPPPGGELSQSGPGWTVDGSYYVFRRLRQDVPAFQAGIDTAATQLGMAIEKTGALVVGRYKSGAPVELTGRVDHDPGLGAIGDNINNFEYQGPDPDGQIVPRAAHIRKTYPRDATTPGGNEPDTQRHRLLRRGIPYGQSFRGGADATGPNGAAAEFPLDRGLLFQCYGRSIVEQFELVTQRWITNPNFTETDDGVDGVLSAGPMKIVEAPQVHSVVLQRFVTATGGEYFFSPSVTALHDLAGT